MSQDSEVHDQQHPTPDEASQSLNEAAHEAGDRFVGQWNRLVSTTNWEKGRIICQWREALMASGAAVTEYSDESWAQLVGGVTSQHVGRLRRVFQRFGDVFDQYEGLYWSHFQAALDWDDAEMWLEGAIRNEFSVSQMRGKRWETLGHAGEPLDDAEDVPSVANSSNESAVVESGTAAGETAASSRAEHAVVLSPPTGGEECDVAADDDEAAAASIPRRDRLKIQLDDLPDDLADAFEQFKLAIISHRRSNWTSTSPEAVMECLDALRAITLAPLD